MFIMISFKKCIYAIFQSSEITPDVYPEVGRWVVGWGGWGGWVVARTTDLYYFNPMPFSRKL